MIRKGDISLSTIVWIIAGALFLAIMIGFVFQVKERSSGEFDEKACSASVLANAQLRVGRAELSSTLKCPTQRISLKGTSTVANQREIARALQSCHSIFLEGKRELFSGNGVYCHICSTIEFEKKDQPGFGISKYLATTPAFPPHAERTFAQYLVGHKSDEEYLTAGQLRTLNELKSISSAEVNPEQTYAVVFWYAKGTDLVLDLVSGLEVESVGALGAGGGVAGAAVAGVAWVPVLAGVGVGLVAGPIYYYFNTDDLSTASATLLLPYDRESLQRLHCTNFPAETH